MRILLLLCLFAVAAVGRDYPIEVIRAIDGDTIVANVDLGFDIMLKTQHIRLVEINSPERGEAGYAEARDRIVRLAAGKRAILSTDGDKRDRYGRMLGRVKIGDVDLSALQLAAGVPPYLPKPRR